MRNEILESNNEKNDERRGKMEILKGVFAVQIIVFLPSLSDTLLLKVWFPT